MTTFTRRTLVKGGTALAAAGALTGQALLDWARAWAQAAPWKPEKGAQLSHAALEVFRAVGGRRVRGADRRLHQGDRRQGQRSRANPTKTCSRKPRWPPTPAPGPDLFWGLYSLPHLFPQKCVDVTDVADYLGKKYGGWVPTRGDLRQERQQVDRHPGLLQRQHA